MSEELINKIIIHNFHEFGDEFGNALVGLQQENKQLKSVLDELNENNVYWVNRCANVETMLHEREIVLDEIREYINEHTWADLTFKLYLTENEVDEIRKILDKVKE